MGKRCLACLLLLLAATADARRLTPGVAFMATLQSDATGATASMTWRTRRTCPQFQLLGFRCLGTWTWKVRSVHQDHDGSLVDGGQNGGVTIDSRHAGISIRPAYQRRTSRKPSIGYPARSA